MQECEMGDCSPVIRNAHNGARTIRKRTGKGTIEKFYSKSNI